MQSGKNKYAKKKLGPPTTEIFLFNLGSTVDFFLDYVVPTFSFFFDPLL
jgi:hypothetical protein